MSHLLMIESWVGGTGRILPEAILAAGHRYTFVARRPEHYDGGTETHPVLRHAARVVRLETNDTASLLEALKRLHREDPFDGVLSICDYYLDTVVRVAEALRVPHPFPRAIALERRKHLVRRALDAAGIPNPRYELTDSWDATQAAAATIGYPVIIKPTDLASSAHVRLVRSEGELAESFAALESFPRNFRDQPREPVYLLEEYLGGEEVSVETCTVAGDTTVLGVTDKSLTGAPFFIEDGHMFPAALPEGTSAALEGFATDVLRAVGHDQGVAHIEVKLTAAGPRLIEINPRLAGNYIVELIRRVTGVDLLQVTIDLALGRRPSLAAAPAGARSAAIKFLIPSHGGLVREIRGTARLGANPRVQRWHMDGVEGKRVAPPVDNACYLGHVVAVDSEGFGARAFAEEAVGSLEVVLER